MLANNRTLNKVMLCDFVYVGCGGAGGTCLSSGVGEGQLHLPSAQATVAAAGAYLNGPTPVHQGQITEKIMGPDKAIGSSKCIC
jgi:hypothetical protein